MENVDVSGISDLPIVVAGSAESPSAAAHQGQTPTDGLDSDRTRIAVEPEPYVDWVCERGGGDSILSDGIAGWRSLLQAVFNPYSYYSGGFPPFD